MQAALAGLTGAAVVNTVLGITPEGSLGGPLAPGLSAKGRLSLADPANVPPLARMRVPGAGPGVVSMVSGRSVAAFELIPDSKHRAYLPLPYYGC